MKTMGAVKARTVFDNMSTDFLIVILEASQAFPRPNNFSPIGGEGVAESCREFLVFRIWRGGGYKVKSGNFFRHVPTPSPISTPDPTQPPTHPHNQNKQLL